MIDNKEIYIGDNLESHTMLLGVHDRDIQELKQKTHKLNNNFKGLESHVELIQEYLKEIKTFQSNIDNKLDVITESVHSLEAVKKVITAWRFWLFVGWVTLVGLIVIIDHLEHFKHLLGFI